MKFWKMNGAGNDFIIVNNIEEKIDVDKYPMIAKTLCERHLSIGADGFMVVEKATIKDADYRMIFINADGTIGEMCGNGARCICRYGYENGLAGDTQRVQTDAGIVIGHRIDGREYKIRLNEPCNFNYDPMVIDGKEYECAYVELGNPGIPHIAVPMKNLKDIPQNELFELGRKMRYSDRLTKGANVNFYELLDKDYIYERTYERGVEDFTYACGTGTGSVVTVLTLQGKVSGKDVKVDMRGGRLTIDVNVKDEIVTDIFLTGPTNIVVKGEVFDEDLIL